MTGEWNGRVRSVSWTTILTGTFPNQAASEYTAMTVRSMLHTAGQAVQEHWYYAAGGVVLLVLLWGYLRK
jgi:hypothetical protein